MGRWFSILLTILGLVLIALGLWVSLHFEKMPMPNSEAIQRGYVIQRHPAADTGSSIMLAGAVEAGE